MVRVFRISQALVPGGLLLVLYSTRWLTDILNISEKEYSTVLTSNILPLAIDRERFYSKNREYKPNTARSFYLSR